MQKQCTDDIMISTLPQVQKKVATPTAQGSHPQLLHHDQHYPSQHLIVISTGFI